MKTREQFREKFADLLLGKILAGYRVVEANQLNVEPSGRFARQQGATLNDLLDEMHDFITESIPAVEAKGVTLDEQAGFLIDRWAKASKESQDKIVARFRVAVQEKTAERAELDKQKAEDAAKRQAMTNGVHK